MRQRDDAGLDGRQQQVVFKRIEQFGSRHSVQDVVDGWLDVTNSIQIR
jgi:hypothetical protein